MIGFLGLLLVAAVSSISSSIPRNDGICGTALPHVNVAEEAHPSALFDDATYFQRVFTLLVGRHYIEASRVYHHDFDPVFGKNYVQYGPSTNFFLMGRTRLGLIALYQDNFCNGYSHFVDDFYDANAIQPFEHALEEAIRGNFAAARADDEVAYSRDTQFSYPDILSGVLCESRGDHINARKYWLRAASNEGPTTPDATVYPDRYVAMQLLIHFKP